MQTLQDLAAFLSSPAGSAPAATGTNNPSVFSGAGYVSPGGWAQAVSPDSVTIDNRNSTYQPGYGQQWQQANAMGVPGYGARQDPDGRTALAMQAQPQGGGYPAVLGGTVPDQFGKVAPQLNPMASAMLQRQLTQAYLMPQTRQPSYVISSKGDDYQSFANGNFSTPSVQWQLPQGDLTGMGVSRPALEDQAKQYAQAGIPSAQPFNLQQGISNMMQDPRALAVSGMNPIDYAKALSDQQASAANITKTQMDTLKASQEIQNSANSSLWNQHDQIVKAIGGGNMTAEDILQSYNQEPGSHPSQVYIPTTTVRNPITGALEPNIPDVPAGADAATRRRIEGMHYRYVDPNDISALKGIRSQLGIDSSSPSDRAAAPGIVVGAQQAAMAGLNPALLATAAARYQQLQQKATQPAAAPAQADNSSALPIGALAHNMIVNGIPAAMTHVGGAIADAGTGAANSLLWLSEFRRQLFGGRPSANVPYMQMPYGSAGISPDQINQMFGVTNPQNQSLPVARRVLP